MTAAELEPIYVEARRVLLDALEALDDQLESVVIVGAQAVYLWVGDADLAVAPYTTDADFVVSPITLKPEPTLVDAMSRAGFKPHPQEPGIWVAASGICVDLIVPASLAGSGRRAARLAGHGPRAARRAVGLEAALVDNHQMEVGALDEADARVATVRVAGPGALLVSKLHKIGERLERPNRLKDKDAYDVLRLLQAVATSDLAASLRILAAHQACFGEAKGAVRYLGELFGSEDGLGAVMAARAAYPLRDEDEVQQACAALAGDLIGALGAE